MTKIKVTYAINGVDPKTIEIPHTALPVVGDYFIPDMTTRNGHLVTRRNMFADGTVQLHLVR